LRGGGL